MTVWAKAKVRTRRDTYIIKRNGVGVGRLRFDATRNTTLGGPGWCGEALSKRGVKVVFYHASAEEVLKWFKIFTNYDPALLVSDEDYAKQQDEDKHREAERLDSIEKSNDEKLREHGGRVCGKEDGETSCLCGWACDNAVECQGH